MKLQLLIYINMSIAYDDGWEAYIWMGYTIEIVLYLMTAVSVPITYHLLCHTPILAYLLWFMTIANFLYVTAYLVHMLDISWSLRNVIGLTLNIFISWVFSRVSSEELSRKPSEPILDSRGRILYIGAKQDDYFSQLDAQWA
ncbi:unnamed protein product, partial [Mesorhabditis belari]|uniref:Uncharacterized protein n=1 Tax=Mesorhabditis belari TaxID=2138241 RepID=A0AAF3EQP7_9BILA